MPRQDPESKKKYLVAKLRKRLQKANGDDQAPSSDEEFQIHANKRSKAMQGNKVANKNTRKIEVGWIHQGQQVQKKGGGGARQIVVSKDATGEVIIEEAIKLFFPEGISKRGLKVTDVHLIDVCDFSYVKFPASQTVGETYEKEKPSGILRYYLSTTLRKDIPKASSEGTSESEIVCKGGPEMSHIAAPEMFHEVAPSHVAAPSYEVAPSHVAAPSYEVAPSHVAAPSYEVAPSHVAAPETSHEVAPSHVAAPSHEAAPFHEAARSHEAAPSHDAAPSHVAAPETFHKGKQDSSCTRSLETSYGLYPVFSGEVCISTQPLEITYFREIESSYCEVVSTLKARSRNQCFYTNMDEDDETDKLDPDAVLDPLMNGYRVAEISKGQTCFVRRTTRDDDGVGIVTEYEFPSLDSADSPDPVLICHQPNEVWGYEEGKLVLGIVSPHHNHEGLQYEWYCNGKSVYSDGCLIVVNTPGLYHCQLRASVSEDGAGVKEILRDSNVIQVVRIPDNVSQTCNETPPSEERNRDSPLVVTWEDEQLQMSDVVVDHTEAINHGSFGEVFRGKYKGKNVAVKRIKSKRAKRPDKVILKEATIHRQLSSQQIVKFIGAGMDACHVYILTELVEGRNMEEVIYSSDLLNDDLKVKAVGDLLEAVAYLHAHEPQIIHQDIKPANILIPDNATPAKLCDLGLAKIRSYDIASSTACGVHSPGTPEYMSPETLVKHEKATTSSDMWSVGITLIEWFVGTDAWDLQNIDEEEEPVMHIKQLMRNREAPPTLGRLKLHLSLVQPCVEYNATDRPAADNLLRRFKCPSCAQI